MLLMHAKTLQGKTVLFLKIKTFLGFFHRRVLFEAKKKSGFPNPTPLTCPCKKC
jgi:hypothetical protein